MGLFSTYLQPSHFIDSRLTTDSQQRKTLTLLFNLKTYLAVPGQVVCLPLGVFVLQYSLPLGVFILQYSLTPFVNPNQSKLVVHVKSSKLLSKNLSMKSTEIDVFWKRIQRIIRKTLQRIPDKHKAKLYVVDYETKKGNPILKYRKHLCSL